jgi:hypothetical protein
MAGVWSTKEMVPADDTELFAEATIRELFVYCCFLVILSLGRVYVSLANYLV